MKGAEFVQANQDKAAGSGVAQTKGTGSKQVLIGNQRKIKNKNRTHEKSPEGKRGEMHGADMHAHGCVEGRKYRRETNLKETKSQQILEDNVSPMELLVNCMLGGRGEMQWRVACN